MRIQLSKDEFDDALYLSRNDSVQNDIEFGKNICAYEHFLLNGNHERQMDYRKLTRDKIVTVVVPIYNAETFLKATLESVLNQTYTNWECILVNDFSTDGSLAIAKQFVSRDKRFKLVVHKANGGLSAARNTGLRAAHGEYICFLDSDDLLSKDSLANRVDAICEADHPRLMGSYSGSLTIQEHTRVAPASSPQSGMKVIDFITSSAMCPFNANQSMFKTMELRHLGGFDERLQQAEDWDYWLRILRHGYCFIPTNVRDVTYRARAESMVRRDPLCHLEVSWRHFHAAHCYLPVMKTYDDVLFVYRKPWIEYKKQLDIANRVLEFCGMEMARNCGNETIYELAKSMLPDFRHAVLPHRAVEDRIKVGIKRQTNTKGISHNAVNYYLRNEVAQFLEKISCQDKTESDDAEQTLKEAAYFPDHSLDPGIYKAVEVIFLPHKDYHVWSFSLLLPELEKRGVRYMFVDMSTVYRDEGVRRELKKQSLPHVTYNTFVLGNFRPKIIVCMNDWDPIVRNIIVQAQKIGITTVGMVEGVQDYLDVDTGRERQAYRTVRHVILPGKFDERYFNNADNLVWSGGVPRIDELKEEKNALPDKPLAVINTNFTYNVLTEFRDAWVRSAVEACEKAGVDYIISKHPAEQGDFSAYKVGEKSMYDLIREGSVFISRFGSGIIEALAMGRPAIYYNPHNEKIDKFKEPMGAYQICNGPRELVKGLKETIENPKKFLANAPIFVEHHAGVSYKGGISATRKTTDILLNILDINEYAATERRKLLSYLLLMNDAMCLTPAVDHKPLVEKVKKSINVKGRRNVIAIADREKRSQLQIKSSERLVDGGATANCTSETNEDQDELPLRLRRKWRKLRRFPYRYFNDARPPFRYLRTFFAKTA